MQIVIRWTIHLPKSSSEAALHHYIENPQTKSLMNTPRIIQHAYTASDTDTTTYKLLKAGIVMKKIPRTQSNATISAQAQRKQNHRVQNKTTM